MCALGRLSETPPAGLRVPRSPAGCGRPVKVFEQLFVMVFVKVFVMVFVKVFKIYHHCAEYINIYIYIYTYEYISI